MESKTSTTYYKATHPDTGKWIVGETTLGIGQEIWRLVRGDDQTEFLLLLKDDPSKIKWEVLTKKEYDSAAVETLSAPAVEVVSKPSKKKSVKRGKNRGRVAVKLISETETLDFASISEVIRHLEGRVTKAKVTKMVNDPTFSVDGYTIIKAEG